MEFDKKIYMNMFKKALAGDRIKKSQEAFKIKLFLSKAENSLLISKYVKDMQPAKDQPEKLHWDYWAITISYYAMLYAAKAAILSKGYEVNDHDAAQIAVGHLLVPDRLEREDLELLSQSRELLSPKGPERHAN